MKVLQANTGKGSRKIVVGLTGGIASGKTTAASYLNQAQAIPILDADFFARQAVQPGTPILQAIQAHFGAAVIQANGELNRTLLGEIIFNNATERAWLEQQIHPYVRRKLVAGCRELLKTHDIILCVIPLLFEAKMTDLVDQVWVVTVDAATQLERLMTRNPLTQAQALARIASQMPLAAKVAQADVVLDNSGTLAELQVQIDQAWKRLQPQIGHG